MSKISPNNRNKVLKELSEANIELEDNLVPSEINEDDKKNYHLVLVRSRANPKKRKFDNEVTVQQYNTKIFEKLGDAINVGYDYVGVLHNPTKLEKVQAPAGNTGGGDGAPAKDKPLNVGELVPIIEKETDLEKLKKLQESDNRAGVQNAINKRLEELASAGNQGGGDGAPAGGEGDGPGLGEGDGDGTGEE